MTRSIDGTSGRTIVGEECEAIDWKGGRVFGLEREQYLTQMRGGHLVVKQMEGNQREEHLELNQI